MDISALKDSVGVIGAILALCLSVYAIMTKPAKENSDKLDDLEVKIDDHAERIQAIEGELKHVPDRQAVHDLQLTMKDMQTEMVTRSAQAQETMKDVQINMATISAEAQASNRTLRRMEDFLMKRGAEA
jgi:predicted  nucleic acid-binding Zn-ribbon protein